MQGMRNLRSEAYIDSGRPWPSPSGRVNPSGDASNSAILRNCQYVAVIRAFPGAHPSGDVSNCTPL